MTNPRKKFDLDDLVTRLRTAAKGDDPRAAIKKILEDAVKDPQHVSDGIPTFEDNDTILFEDDTVSIWHCRFMPGYSVPAHDHQMFATIGVYQGAERNDFFENDPNGGIRRSSEVELSAGQVLAIGRSAIHAVGCASEEPCCGIHVYLGSLTTVDRSLFDTAKNAILKFTDENYQRLISAD